MVTVAFVPTAMRLGRPPMATRYGPCRRSESRATRSKIERTADLKAPGSTSPGAASTIWEWT